MKLKIRSVSDENKKGPFWKVLFELRDLGIEEEYDFWMDMYYEEGPDDICELMLIKHPQWLSEYRYNS